MKNKLLIFLIALTFLLSVNFAFATDDNATDLTIGVEDNHEDIDVDDNQLKESESSELLSRSDDSEKISAVVDSNFESIKSGKVTERYIDGVVYEATFYESPGVPLKNTVVFCGINSISYGVNSTTDSKGIVKFPLPLNNGDYKLFLINPVTGEVSSDNIKIFDVLTGGKNLKLYFDSGKYYSVKVFDNDGKPVNAGKKVTFLVSYNKINSKTYKVSTVTKKYIVNTDKKGLAKLKISFKPGTYSVLAKYGKYNVINSILVKPTIIHLTKVHSIGKKTFKFKIKLLNNNGKVLKNKKITVKFNKKTYKAKTNKKGIALFKIKAPKKTGYFKLVSKYKKATETTLLQQYRVY